VKQGQNYAFPESVKGQRGKKDTYPRRTRPSPPRHLGPGPRSKQQGKDRAEGATLGSHAPWTQPRPLGHCLGLASSCWCIEDRGGWCRHGLGNIPPRIPLTRSYIRRGRLPLTHTHHTPLLTSSRSSTLPPPLFSLSLG
jgi:hypothetical protein